MMRNMRKQRTRADEETETNDDSITSDGVCVYFYAEVSRANNLKLIKCRREATAAYETRPSTFLRTRSYTWPL